MHNYQLREIFREISSQINWNDVKNKLKLPLLTLGIVFVIVVTSMVMRPGDVGTLVMIAAFYNLAFALLIYDLNTLIESFRGPVVPMHFDNVPKDSKSYLKKATPKSKK